MTFAIKEIEPQYVDEIVDVHIKAFPTFFLTFLGPRFLKEFYNSFIYDKTGIGFVAIDKNRHKALGVIVGPLEPAGYFKRLLRKRWYAFCLASIVAILKRPAVIKRLFRALFYRGDSPDGSHYALLSSIAVIPNAQGQGIGRALVNKWTQEVHRRGGSGCFLTTDAQNNEKTNNFYQKLGWKIESSYATPYGRIMNRYVLEWSP